MSLSKTLNKSDNTIIKFECPCGASMNIHKCKTENAVQKKIEKHFNSKKHTKYLFDYIISSMKEIWSGNVEGKNRAIIEYLKFFNLPIESCNYKTYDKLIEMTNRDIGSNVSYLLFKYIDDDLKIDFSRWQ
tara:strand:- start:3104 stop:3496 length:393 start_codon:yes stop_codon:yes gene_type:complete